MLILTDKLVFAIDWHKLSFCQHFANPVRHILSAKVRWMSVSGVSDNKLPQDETRVKNVINYMWLSRGKKSKKEHVKTGNNQYSISMARMGSKGFDMPSMRIRVKVKAWPIVIESLQKIVSFGELDFAGANLKAYEKLKRYKYYIGSLAQPRQRDTTQVDTVKKIPSR